MGPLFRHYAIPIVLFCVSGWVLLRFIACRKDNPLPRANAEIFRFNAQKCFCCWGWYVKRGGDTFKIDVLPAGIQLSTDIVSPVPVYIETGAIRHNCGRPEYDYYEVTRLRVNP